MVIPALYPRGVKNRVSRKNETNRKKMSFSVSEKKRNEKIIFFNFFSTKRNEKKWVFPWTKRNETKNLFYFFNFFSTKRNEKKSFFVNEKKRNEKCHFFVSFLLVKNEICQYLQRKETKRKIVKIFSVRN